MRRSRLTDAQIVGIVRRAESGARATTEVRRRHGISKQTRRACRLLDIRSGR
jgi:hypothetical protein